MFGARTGNPIHEVPRAQPIHHTMFIVCAAFCVGLGLSFRLWYAPARLYPRIPIIPGLHVAPPVELLLLLALFVSLVLASFRKRSALMARAAVAFTAALVLLDQSRLQPWTYEYLLILFVLSFSDFRTLTSRRNAGIMTTCRLIIVALYFWSAVQKLNATFLTQIWPDFSAGISVATGLPVASLARIAWVVPVAELGIALGLLTVRFRRVAVIGAVAMHAGILLILLAAGENSVVWPWNLAMAALTIVLFGATQEGVAGILRGDRSLRHAFIAVTAGVLPFLSLAGLWDAYLSAALYSGNTIQAVVLVAPETIASLPTVIAANTWQESRPMFIDINRWSYAELNVPAYPAERVMKAVGRDICRNYVRSPEDHVRILGRPNQWTTTRTSRSYPCSASSIAGSATRQPVLTVSQ